MKGICRRLYSTGIRTRSTMPDEPALANVGDTVSASRALLVAGRRRWDLVWDGRPRGECVTGLYQERAAKALLEQKGQQ